jgi:uncharacterized membrane protein YecN with MAPEG domain
MWLMTSLFAGFFGLYFVHLAWAVIRLRRARQVALGAQGFQDLEGAIRAHGNFAEYVPLGLILLGLLESHGVHPALVALLGGVLAVGRVLHAQALKTGRLKLRVRGMVLTFVAIITLAVANIGFGVWGFLRA